jgi:1,4-alpha-glucan branching enzyme
MRILPLRSAALSARSTIALFASLSFTGCPTAVAPMLTFDAGEEEIASVDAGFAHVGDDGGVIDSHPTPIAWPGLLGRDDGGAPDGDGGAPAIDDAGMASASDAGPLPLVDAGTPLPSQGTTFRVWAPHADSVHVAGSFNGWNPTAHALVDTGDDHFALHVDDAMPGDEYKFVIVNDGQTLWRADPRGHAMTNSTGNSVVVDHDAYAWQHQGFVMPPKDSLVIYEMHVGTYNDVEGGAPGTFASVIEKLDHLSMLGINAIELMPVSEFAGDYSWGYNSAALFAPESAYGSPDDLKALVDECHARGIAVLIDVVHNHWGPSDMSMWCFDGECLGEDNGGVYFYTGARRESGWGPRPDYGRSEVRDFIRDNTRLWLETYRMDGMRWDSTVNIRTAAGQELPEGWWLLQSANDLALGIGGKLMIAEDLHTNAWVTKTTGEGGAGFDSQWDATFFHPVNATLITPSDAARNMFAVRDAIVSTGSGWHTGRVVYTESHDEVANGRQRIPAMISPADPSSQDAKKRSTLGAGLVMTTPGIPMIFQGQEMLEDEWFRDTDPLDWQKATTHAGIVALYRDLIALRKNDDGKTAGLTGAGVNVHHVNDGAKVIAYHRWKYGGIGDDVVVVANFSNVDWATYDFGVPYAGAWEVVMNTDDATYDSEFTGTGSDGVIQSTGNGLDGMAHRVRVSLPRYSMVILARGEP